MPERISTALGVAHESMESVGVFDRFVDIDSLLHVDPHLLSRSKAPEMMAAADTLEHYWQDTATVVSNIFEDGDRFWRESVKRFTFPEHPNAGLGYSLKGSAGSAVGPKTAAQLVDTARQIIAAGIKDPKIFELVGLLEPGVGPDLISDITIRIIEPHLLDYTERVAVELGMKTSATKVGVKEYGLPIDPATGKFIILFPKDVLRDLPVSLSWDDIDTVCAHNEALRAQMNGVIGDNWRRAFEDHSKERLREVLFENPEVLKDLLDQYKEKPATPYDFEEDILGETIWLEESQDAVNKYPLSLAEYGPVTPENILKIVRAICTQFRQLVENNGLNIYFYTESGKVRHERFAQLLFFAIADSYCKANNLDLSPESNSGRGPVDFKISRGYTARVLVEVKWSKNSKLVHGFETQLEEYAKAERTSATVLLVIQVTDSHASIDKVLELEAAALRDKKQTPEVKVVDGRKKDSASKYVDGK